MIRIQSQRPSGETRQESVVTPSRALRPTPGTVVLRRIEPGRNMVRFYLLSVEPTLFGDVALVRQWGRIGTVGRCRVDLHANQASASAALEDLAAAKRARGYC